MPRDVKDLKREILNLPSEKEITVIYKTDTVKQLMKLLEKDIKLLK
jgi:hypothetical protein